MRDRNLLLWDSGNNKNVTARARSWCMRGQMLHVVVCVWQQSEVSGIHAKENKVVCLCRIDGASWGKQPCQVLFIALCSIKLGLPAQLAISSPDANTILGELAS